MGCSTRPRANVNWTYCVKDKLSLRRADLRGAILRYASMREADLSSAQLGNADLSYGKFSNANLSGASLRLASMSGAELDYVKEAFDTNWTCAAAICRARNWTEPCGRTAGSASMVLSVAVCSSAFFALPSGKRPPPVCRDCRVCESNN